MGRSKQISDEALLAAARAVFSEQGYGASTREIAGRAGISEATLYQRHHTKLDLFFAAMVPPPIALAAWPAKASSRAELESLASYILAYFREAMPILLQLVTHPSFQLADLKEREAQLPLLRLAELLSASLQRHALSGNLRADSARLKAATLTLIATLHSLALFERMGVHGGSFPEPVVRQIVALILAGLKPQKRSETWPPNTLIRTLG